MSAPRTFKLFSGPVHDDFVSDVNTFLAMNSDEQKAIMNLVYDIDTIDAYGPAGLKIIEKYKLDQTELSNAFRYTICL